MEERKLLLSEWSDSTTSGFPLSVPFSQDECVSGCDPPAGPFVVF